MTRLLNLAPAFAVALTVSVSPAAVSGAFAAGSGSSPATVTCRKGKMWDKAKKKCVNVKKSSGLSDDNLVDVARDFAYRTRYQDALDVLALVSNANDPRVLNYKGYATRKLGRVREGMVYYHAALGIDPDYTLVREYLGEAYLMLGEVEGAREQLAEIEARCGTDCREYAMLAREIGAYGAN